MIPTGERSKYSSTSARSGRAARAPSRTPRSSPTPAWQRRSRRGDLDLALGGQTAARCSWPPSGRHRPRCGRPWSDPFPLNAPPHAGRTAVGCRDDLATGEPGIPCRTADGRSVRWGVHDSAWSRHPETIGGDDRVDHSLLDVGEDLLVGDIVGMLDADQHRVHPAGAPLGVVLHGQPCRLPVGTRPAQGPVAPGRWRAGGPAGGPAGWGRASAPGSRRRRADHHPWSRPPC